MRTSSPIVIGCLLLSGCGSGYEWRGLPDVDGVQGWLLAPGGQPAQWFGPSGTSVPRFERGRLWALPMPSETLATHTPPQLGTGNLLPVLANFALEEEGWAIEDPTPIRVPLVPDVCGDQCVLYTPCPNCSSDVGSQTCGPCAPEAPAPASLPSKVCPPGWDATEHPDGHFNCVPTEAAGLRSACPAEQRWSWDEQRCVDIAPCAAPMVGPTENAIYVDAAAGPGGDGSPGNPLQRVPARPTANQTIVLAPGTYSGAVRLHEPGVRLVGHGLCSVLTGTAGVDVLRVVGVEAEVERLWLDSEGTGRTLLVSSGAQLSLHDALLTGSDRLLGSDGVVTVQRSRLLRDDECNDIYCDREQAAVHLRAGGVVEDSDIEGPVALWGQFANLTVRKTRLMPRSDGYGLFGSGPGVFSIEDTTSFGGRTGMFFRADGELQVGLTDVRIATRTSTLGPLISEGVVVQGEDQFPAQLDLLRASIESSGVGVVMNYGTVNTNQFRLKAQGRGIEAIENERIHIVSVTDSWLESGEELIIVSGSDAFVGNSWLRACVDCVEPDRRARVLLFAAPRFEDVTPDSLEVRVAHMLAGDRVVARSFSAMELYDLTASSSRVHMFDSREIEGSRWNVTGLSSVVEIRERFNVSDIAIRIEEPGAATCIRASAEVVINKFSIEGPEGTVPLGLKEIVPGTTAQVERWRVMQGSLPSGPLVGESTDGCETLEPYEISPIVDRVLFR